jgi:hypothetical protein
MLSDWLVYRIGVFFVLLFSSFFSTEGLSHCTLQSSYLRLNEFVFLPKRKKLQPMQHHVSFLFSFSFYVYVPMSVPRKKYGILLINIFENQKCRKFCCKIGLWSCVSCHGLEIPSLTSLLKFFFYLFIWFWEGWWEDDSSWCAVLDK